MKVYTRIRDVDGLILYHAVLKVHKSETLENLFKKINDKVQAAQFDNQNLKNFYKFFLGEFCLQKTLQQNSIKNNFCFDFILSKKVT